MSYAELPAFMARLRERTDVAARALELTILTLCRTGDVTGQGERNPDKPRMMWKHVNLEARMWTVPNTKTSKGDDATEFPIPLSDRAMAALEEMRGRHPEFVFAERNKPLGKNDMQNLLSELAPGHHVHGFRATFKTWTDEQTHGQAEVAETCLAHKIVGNSVEAAYKRRTMIDKRRALLQAWADHCNGATAPMAMLRSA
jgi:integrase